VGEKRFHIVAWSSTNPTWTALIIKPMLDERPANKHLFFIQGVSKRALQL